MYFCRTFSTCVSSNNVLGSVRIDNRSSGSSSSKVPKLCLLLASFMVMIWGKVWEALHSIHNLITLFKTKKTAHMLNYKTSSGNWHIPPNFWALGHWRSYQSCSVHPSLQLQSPAPVHLSHRHQETTGWRMSRDGPPWENQSEQFSKTSNFHNYIITRAWHWLYRWLATSANSSSKLHSN